MFTSEFYFLLFSFTAECFPVFGGGGGEVTEKTELVNYSGYRMTVPKMRTVRIQTFLLRLTLHLVFTRQDIFQNFVFAHTVSHKICVLTNLLTKYDL
jgi:hypothetical protein